MKILDLPLKAVWYLMIESGDKPEEYREMKPYWMRRICACYHHGMCRHRTCLDCIKIGFSPVPSGYTHVLFRYGYSKRTMLFKLDSISIGKGKPEWGALEHRVFILKLGERVKE